MPSLRDYVTETEQWADTPREGDDLDIEIAPDELAEGVVIESDGEYIVLEMSGSAVAALEQRGLLSERIGRYGAVGSSRGMGFTLGEQEKDKLDEMLPMLGAALGRAAVGAGAGALEKGAASLAGHAIGSEIQDMFDEKEIDEGSITRMLELAGLNRHMDEEANTTDPLAAKAAALAPVGTMSDPGRALTVDEGVMSDIDLELQNIAASGDEEELIDAMGGLKGNNVALYLEDMMSNLADELSAKGMNDVVADEDRMIEILMDRIVDQFGGELDESQIPEAPQGLSEEMELILQRAGVKEAFDQRKADAYNRAVQAGHSPEQAEKMAGIRDEDRDYYEIDVDGQMKRLAVRAATAVPVQEAEYQGRKVPLGKPMRGDVKKFKVYVKDPKTGNVKKVNFGHGGKSAKRAGEKTLSIKKSNPARRKSFRARHNCDNPGPRTKARYWSCRAW